MRAFVLVLALLGAGVLPPTLRAQSPADRTAVVRIALDTLCARGRAGAATVVALGDGATEEGVARLGGYCDAKFGGNLRMTFEILRTDAGSRTVALFVQAVISETSGRAYLRSWTVSLTRRGKSWAVSEVRLEEMS